MNLLESLFAVIIIGIDNAERAINLVLSGKNCLTCAPRLGSSLWEFTRNIVKILESVSYLYAVGGANALNSVSDSLTEILFDVFSDNEYDFIEACLDCIVNGIVHDDVI